MKDNLNTFQKHEHVLVDIYQVLPALFAFAGISMRVAFTIGWIRYAFYMVG